MSEEKHIDSIISFQKKEMKKLRKKGERAKAMMCYQSIELMYELKRALIV